MLKSTSMKALCALVISAFMHLSSAAAATFFPALADGDVFTGLMYLNPTTPLSSYTTDTAYIYVSPPAFGFVTVNIPGGTFLGSADLVEAMPGSGDQWRWFMQAQSGTFNGVALPLSIISLILYGSTASTSILPDLPSYTFGDSLRYSNIQLFVGPPDGSQAVSYFGLLTSLAQVNAEPGLYSFAGTIYAPPIPPVIPTPLPPAFALFAAGLGMMAFFVRRKKTRTARAA